MQGTFKRILSLLFFTSSFQLLSCYSLYSSTNHHRTISHLKSLALVANNPDLINEIRAYLTLPELLRSQIVNRLFKDIDAIGLWQCPRTMDRAGLMWLARHPLQSNWLNSLTLFVEQTRPDSLGLLSLQQASVLSRTGTLLQLLKNLSLLKLKLRGDTIPVTIARSFFRALPSLRALRSLEVDLSQISFGQHGIFRDFVITALANALGQLSQLTNLQINLSRSRANIESRRLLSMPYVRCRARELELNLGLGDYKFFQALASQTVSNPSEARILRLPYVATGSLIARFNQPSALGAGGNLHALSVDLSQNGSELPV